MKWIRRGAVSLLAMTLSACGDSGAGTPGTIQVGRSEHVSLLSAAISETIVRVSGPWGSGEGGTIVLDVERVALVYPEDPERGARRSDVLDAFDTVGRSFSLAMRRGTNAEEVQCEDREGWRFQFCTIDPTTLLIQVVSYTELPDGIRRIMIASKQMGDIVGRIDFLTHEMKFRLVQGDWELSEYSMGVFN